MRQSHRLEIRLTDDEWIALEQKMIEACISNRSAYIRKMAIDGYVLKLDLSDLKEVLRLLRINSNNLNQYAKRANETGEIYREDIQKLQQEQTEIWKLMKKLLNRLVDIW